MTAHKFPGLGRWLVGALLQPVSLVSALLLPLMILSILPPVSIARAMPGASPPGPGGGVLESIELHPEGRLLQIDIGTGSDLTGYTVIRRGPPEKRDLVVQLPGYVSETPGTVDTGDYQLPIRVTTAEKEAAGAVLEVVFGNVGDSLVSVSQDGARLSLLIIPPETRSEESAAYRIGPNDMLQIDVFGHEDLNKTLKVSPKGLVNFPLIGNVGASGRTVDEIAQEITERLGEKFLRDPHVTVSVWEYLSQWVNVIGEVAQPGRYYMTGPTTLIDALSQAGGLSEKAGNEILVTRRPEQVDPASAGEVFRVAVDRLFSREGTALNLQLRSGDIIHVTGVDPDRAQNR